MKYFSKRKDLNKEIAQKKETLNNLLDSESLTSCEVIQLSMEIDKLIVRYIKQNTKSYKLRSIKTIKADELKWDS